MARPPMTPSTRAPGSTPPDASRIAPDTSAVLRLCAAAGKGRLSATHVHRTTLTNTRCINETAIPLLQVSDREERTPRTQSALAGARRLEAHSGIPARERRQQLHGRSPGL